MPATDVDLLRCPLFHDMTADERRQVLELVEYRVHPAGATLIEEGKSLQLLSIVLRGRCQVVKQLKTGVEQELAVLDGGAVFGEMSFFNPAPHSATIRALSDVEVMQLPRDRFEGLEITGTRAAYKLVRNALRIVSERLRKMDEWTCNHVNGHSTTTHQEEWREFRKRLYSGWDF